jgi:hypothetical protein
LGLKKDKGRFFQPHPHGMGLQHIALRAENNEPLKQTHSQKIFDSHLYTDHD